MRAYCESFSETNAESILQWRGVIGKIAVCDRVHEIEQRLARWLLMSQDRVESDILRPCRGLVVRV